MTLIKWNAKRPSIFSEFDNLFDSFISDFPTSYKRSSSWTPKFEVLNTDNSYRIRADLPGMIKNDVNKFLFIIYHHTSISYSFDFN